MNETIRQHLNRRIRWLGAAGLGGWLLVAAAAGLFSGHRSGGPPSPLFFAGFALFGGAMLLIQRVRCPKCSTPLGQIATQMAFSLFRKRKINYCPYCGVSLEEPMPEKLIS
jgi:hypothetical protein